VRENRTQGSVQGTPGNRRSYCDGFLGKNMRTPLISEAELRHYDRAQAERQFSYSLTQRLTFFVISVELVFCGYILLNAGKLGAIASADELFALAGIAAFFGVLWRFFYNQTYHNNAHGSGKKTNVILAWVQLVSYCVYVSLSVIFFVLVLAVGYSYLHEIEEKAKDAEVGCPTNKEQATEGKKPNHRLKPTAYVAGATSASV